MKNKINFYGTGEFWIEEEKKKRCKMRNDTLRYGGENSKMKCREILNLPSGRIFIINADGYTIEATEMRDVSISGKDNIAVREELDPKFIWKYLVPYFDKWLLTVSTQKGCTHSCKFCDVAHLPFKGNLTRNEILEQVIMILDNSPYVKNSAKVKIGFARMGEPAYNLDNVLGAIKELPWISHLMNRNFQWLPCFNSILPRAADVLDEVLKFKENECNGYMHVQISCNSTDEKQRKQLFGGADVFTIPEVVEKINKHKITNRTVDLNFILVDGIEVSLKKLKKLDLDPNKIIVKLIPLNATNNATENALKTVANYSNYEKLKEIKKEFEAEGIPIIVDAIARCEEAGLCCGQIAQTYR